VGKLKDRVHDLTRRTRGRRLIGINRGVAGETIQQHGAARLAWFAMGCGGIVDHRNAGYVIRMSGVVGGRGSEASPYPD